MNRTSRSLLLAGLLASVIAYAFFPNIIGLAQGTLKVWSTSETIRAADLNANFTAVNNSATELVTNAKVSSVAAIARSKLVNGINIPKAFGVVKTLCTSGTCTLAASQGTTSVTRTSMGVYAVNLNYTAADAGYGALVTGGTDGTPLVVCNCNAILASFLTTSFGIKCMDTTYDGGPAAVKDCLFTYAVLDVN